MDGLEFEDQEEEGDLMHSAIGLAHIIGISLLVRYLWRRCCRKGDAEGGAAAGEALHATPDQLQPKKRVLTSYFLWLVTGLLGVHHFYLGRITHGLFAMWSLNLFGLGWLVDMVMIPFYVRGFNARQTSPQAEYDGSRRTLLCKLPLVIFSLLFFVIGGGAYMPRILHITGIVDIDRIAAQTQVNPYELLGLSSGASLSEAKKAYHKESLRWHPDRNHGCGKTCENKMSEITKAFELIKKRRAPPPVDRTWQGWLQDLGSDWVHVMEVFSSEENNGQSDQKTRPGGAKAKTDL